MCGGDLYLNPHVQSVYLLERYYMNATKGLLLSEENSKKLRFQRVLFSSSIYLCDIKTQLFKNYLRIRQ